MNIPFNKPFLTGNELVYIEDAVKSGKLSGNGKYTKKCQHFFEDKYGFSKTLLTSSCTDALEMCALLLDIVPGDEVIMPSYTFVSTANAFLLRGAQIRFVDSRSDHPGMDESKIEELISDKTKAIVVMHYAGVACDMDKIMDLADSYGLKVIEDAAQSVDAFYNQKPLGRIGHLSAFSFHETKNIISGEGGLLGINDPSLIARAEIIWEKGTNRSAFFRGEIDKYNWVELGSSFLPSEVVAAFLFAQLESLDAIQTKRLKIWAEYEKLLRPSFDSGILQGPAVPQYASNNAHMFYLVCKDNNQRTAIIDHLKSKGILSVFHYLSLHKSPFYQSRHDGRDLPESDRYSDALLRLPLYFDLNLNDVAKVCDEVLISAQKSYRNEPFLVE